MEKKERKRRAVVDWGEAEFLYVHTPDMTMERIANIFGCTSRAVQKQATTKGWTDKKMLCQQQLAEAKRSVRLDQYQDVLQRSIANAVTFQEKVAEVLPAYGDILRAQVADYMERYKKFVQDKKDHPDKRIPMPKSPISPNDIRAIVIALREIHAWERLRQGKPSDIHGHLAVEVSILDLLHGNTADDEEASDGSTALNAPSE